MAQELRVLHLIEHFYVKRKSLIIVLLQGQDLCRNQITVTEGSAFFLQCIQLLLCLFQLSIIGKCNSKTPDSFQYLLPVTGRPPAVPAPHWRNPYHNT
ncbi:MAG: hypothetical protein ACLVJH_02855 [Faecalibacterium prausnitzii]